MSDYPARRRKLSTIDISSIGILKKYGELLATEQRKYFRSTVGGFVSAKQIDKLVKLGYCRVDRVGESLFAVYVGKP